jgi:Transposase, Mutator family
MTEAFQSTHRSRGATVGAAGCRTDNQPSRENASLLLKTWIYAEKTEPRTDLFPPATEIFVKLKARVPAKRRGVRAKEIETRRKAFIRKWRLKHRAVADSSAESGDRLFTFTRLPPPQWRSVRTTNAIERLYEEFKRRIKTQIVLRSADTAAMLFWALLAPGQINMRKVDGWQTLATKPIDQPIDLAAWSTTINLPKAWFLLFRRPLMTAYRPRFRRVPNPDVTVGLRKALWLIRIDASHHFDANQ